MKILGAIAWRIGLYGVEHGYIGKSWFFTRCLEIGGASKVSQETEQEKMLRVAAIEIVAMQLFAMENPEIAYSWARMDAMDRYTRKMHRQRAIELLAEAMG